MMTEVAHFVVEINRSMLQFGGFSRAEMEITPDETHIQIKVRANKYLRVYNLAARVMEKESSPAAK